MYLLVYIFIVASNVLKDGNCISIEKFRKRFQNLRFHFPYANEVNFELQRVTLQMFKQLNRLYVWTEIYFEFLQEMI